MKSAPIRGADIEFITDKDALRPTVGAQAHLTASLENSNVPFEFFNEVTYGLSKIKGFTTIL